VAHAIPHTIVCTTKALATTQQQFALAGSTEVTPLFVSANFDRPDIRFHPLPTCHQVANPGCKRFAPRRHLSVSSTREPFALFSVAGKARSRIRTYLWRLNVARRAHPSSMLLKNRVEAFDCCEHPARHSQPSIWPVGPKAAILLSVKTLGPRTWDAYHCIDIIYLRTRPKRA